MPPKGMTANPIQPLRYRPGKALASDQSSSGSESDAPEPTLDKEITSHPRQQRQPPPKATSFPSAAAKTITSNLRNVDLEERRKKAEKDEQRRLASERAQREQQEKEAGFVTDESAGSSEEEQDDENILRHGVVARKPAIRAPVPRPPPGDDDSGSEDDSSEDSDSDSNSSASSSDAAPKLLRPVFLSKSARTAAAATTNRPPSPSAEQRAQQDAARRAVEADALVQAKLEEAAALRAAGRKDWDDTAPLSELPDDTDGLDPELERAQWVARELTRLKRARAALEAQEAALAEVERRRNMSAAEREAEDAKYVAEQKAEKDGKDKAGFMARYHHRGAFFMDDDEGAAAEGEAGEGLARRNLMGATYADHEGIKDTLPAYLQVRDATMIGRKGRTRYKDMRSEDTGSFGDYKGYNKGVGYDRRRDGDRNAPVVEDERFRPDRPGGAGGATGANAGGLGEGRKRGFAGDERDVKRPRA